MRRYVIASSDVGESPASLLASARTAGATATWIVTCPPKDIGAARNDVEALGNATVTETDVTALNGWARGRLLRVSDSPGQIVTEGDGMRGRDVFERRCTGCHAMEQNREGPRLRGVFGRASGSVAGFDYSPALAKAHIVWNERTLEQWLADPDALVPGNNMEFHVAKPQERQDLIRFLRDSAGK